MAFYALSISSHERPLFLLPVIVTVIIFLLISTLPKTWANVLNCRALHYKNSHKGTFLSDLTEVYTKHLCRSKLLKVCFFYLLR